MKKIHILTAALSLSALLAVPAVAADSVPITKLTSAAAVDSVPITKLVPVTAVDSVPITKLTPAIESADEAEAIGIIGGADGPTAIYIAVEGENRVHEDTKSISSMIDDPETAQKLEELNTALEAAGTDEEKAVIKRQIRDVYNEYHFAKIFKKTYKGGSSALAAVLGTEALDDGGVTSVSEFEEVENEAE